jgi:hypothetical protein
MDIKQFDLAQIKCWVSSKDQQEQLRTVRLVASRRTLYITLVRRKCMGVCYTSLVSAHHRPDRSLGTRTETCFQIRPKSTLPLWKKLHPKAYWLELKTSKLLAEYLDMLFFYKANCGIMCLSDAVLPKHKTSRITRSVDPNSLNVQVKKCKT